MDLPSFILLLVAMAVLFTALMYIVYVKLHRETKHNMNELGDHYQQQRKAPTTEQPYCPAGCERGVCTLNEQCNIFYHPEPQCCKFDLQCRNCINRKSGNVYYSEGGNTDYIEQNYRSSDPETVNRLNEEIWKQNEYIRDVNQLVNEHNAPLFEQQQTEEQE